jgi:hypothetical protein
MGRREELEESLDGTMLMSFRARQRWNRERRIRAEQIMSDLESGRLARRIKREVAEALAEIAEERQLQRWQSELLRTLHYLREEK